MTAIELVNKKLDEILELLKNQAQGTHIHHHYHYPPTPTTSYPRWPSYPWWSTSGGNSTAGINTITYTSSDGTNGPVNPTA